MELMTTQLSKLQEEVETTLLKQKEGIEKRLANLDLTVIKDINHLIKRISDVEGNLKEPDTNMTAALDSWAKKMKAQKFNAQLTLPIMNPHANNNREREHSRGRNIQEIRISESMLNKRGPTATEHVIVNPYQATGGGSLQR